MFKPILISVAFVICLFLTTNAQTDTTSYDLGRLAVKKQFTQNITIKGTDLERTQFSDLADAINVWLYGTYTNAASIVYVINGNIITDVNVYSIYDVDEVTLVQSALAQVTGAGPGQQMVFIKLKTNRPGKQGVEVAGQTSLVNANDHPNQPGYKSSINTYDQYYLSGYKNFDGVQAGISVDYQHDVMPIITNNEYTVVNPLNFNRFKLNGYLNANLWSGTTLNFGINYTPQQNSENITFPTLPYTTSGANENLFREGLVQHEAGSNISINSRIVKGLTNTLSAAYSHYNFFEGDSIKSVFTNPGYDDENQISFTDGNSNASNFLLRDNLVYQAKIGALDVAPSLNFSYRKYNESYRDSVVTLFLGPGLPSYSYTEQSSRSSEKTYFLTPSVSLGYKDIVDFQIGFVSLLNSSKDFEPGISIDRFFPFASASINVIKPAQNNNLSLQVFGSFSRQNQLLDDPYQTIDGFGSVGFQLLGNTVYGSNSGGSLVFSPSSVNPLKPLNNYQAGFNLGLSKSFSVNYSYFENYNSDIAAEEVPYGGNMVELAYFSYYSKITANRIGLDYKYNGADITWHSDFNISQQQLSSVDARTDGSTYATYLSSGHRYSGGFTNRFSYKSFFAGLDILYQLGQRPMTLAEFNPEDPASPPHVNSIALQNFYFGTQVKVHGVKYAEAFANFHTILQNNSSDITDNRRFYGLGFKAGW